MDTINTGEIDIDEAPASAQTPDEEEFEFELVVDPWADVVDSNSPGTHFRSGCR